MWNLDGPPPWPSGPHAAGQYTSLHTHTLWWRTPNSLLINVTSPLFDEVNSHVQKCMYSTDIRAPLLGPGRRVAYRSALVRLWLASCWGSRSGLIWLHRRATVSTVRIARELSCGEVVSLYIRSRPAKIKITPSVLSPSLFHSPQLRPHAQYPYRYLASPLNQARRLSPTPENERLPAFSQLLVTVRCVDPTHQRSNACLERHHWPCCFLCRFVLKLCVDIFS